MFTGAKQGQDTSLWERSVRAFHGFFFFIFFFRTSQLFSTVEYGDTDTVCQLLQWSTRQKTVLSCKQNLR